MSNRSIPASAPGLPSSYATRRAILAGFAAAPVAVLPTLAGAVGEVDPILIAIAELHALRAREATALEELQRADEGCCRDPDAILPWYVSWSGVNFHSLIQFDESLRDGVLSLCASTSHINEMRVDLRRRLENRAVVYARHGLLEANDAYEAVGDERFELERRVMAMAPTTLAGACALLRVICDILAAREGEGDKDDDDDICVAIVAALAILEPLNGAAKRL